MAAVHRALPSKAQRIVGEMTLQRGCGTLRERMPGLGGTTNNYEILAQLASGGMAEIFLARVTALAGVERHVVLKRILPAFRDDPQMIAMFLDEARLQAQLRHPNIAQLHDVGLLGTSYFYTMEYVHGETVQSLMHKAVMMREPIPLQHILTIAAGVTAALFHAHTRVGADRRPLDIIHRDVSPANIMISFDGGIKLLDFGVARSTGRMTQTRAGVVKGKVAYLSPEQIGEKGVDPRSDLFSLAICLYELLTLHGLFVRSSDLASLAAIVQEMPPPPSQFRRDIPPQIDQLVMTALAKDPSTRFGNADAMHQAVEAAATSANLSMSPSSLGRYLGQMFGQRPEPWLTGAGDVPVTVIGQVIEPTQAHVEPFREKVDKKQAKELERRISTIRRVSQVEDVFDHQTTGKLPQVPPKRMPSAAEHPQWEATVARTPMPEGMMKIFDQVPNEFELDAAETSIASPRYGMPPQPARPSAPDLSRASRPSSPPPNRNSGSAPTQLGPALMPPPSTQAVINPSSGQPLMQSGGNSMLPHDPLMQSGGNPTLQRDPLTQSGGNPTLQRDPLMQSGGNPLRQSAGAPRLPAMPDPARPVGQHPANRQNWEPSTYRTRTPQPEPQVSSSWNVPRILLVAAVLIAVAAAVMIAVT